MARPIFNARKCYIAPAVTALIHWQYCVVTKCEAYHETPVLKTYIVQHIVEVLKYMSDDQLQQSGGCECTDRLPEGTDQTDTYVFTRFEKI